MINDLICKKTLKSVSGDDMKCINQYEPCEYRPTCMIYEFHLFKDMDNTILRSYIKPIKRKNWLLRLIDKLKRK